MVDATRRFTWNLIFLVIVVFLIAAFVTGGRNAKVLEDTTLVINIKGDVVEQYTGSAREAEFAEALNGEAKETQLRDILAALDAAAKDPHIPRILFILDDMGHAGMAKLREIAEAEERCKAAGKQVIAWGSLLGQRQYFIAAHANEIYLHPYGALAISGFGGYRNYYHDALEHLGITINVFRAGKYKSAVEPLTSNSPSKEAEEADAYWLNGAWSEYTADIEKARSLPSGSINALIADAPARLAATGGNLARFALEEKLVDGLKTRDELRALLLQRGKPDNEHKTFRQIGLEDYRAQIVEVGDRSREVGIVVAEGTISDGEEPQGSIGGRSTAELIRKAREDSSVKAIVLRVDSPGGSAFGSELIRRELELARKEGKPVVVSMSDVAASGGYWISTASDRVFADPATITGSIGVFGLFPTADRTMDKLGIHTAGVTTAWPAGATDPRRPMDTRLGSVIQSSIGYMYKEFLEHVSAARKITTDQVNDVAQGRVWTGKQALDRGLIDEMGGLGPAIQAAANFAKLGDGYRPTYVESEPRGWSKILASLPTSAVKVALGDWLGVQAPIGDSAAGQLQRDFGFLKSAVSGAEHAYATCLCEAP